MKVLVTATGSDMDAELDPRFGRAKHFILVDAEDGSFSAHDNAQNLNAAQGAGIQAAETVLRLGAEAVITGNAGPKAFRVLSAGGVKVYLCEKTTIAEAVRRFKAGELKVIDAANVDGHW